MANLGLSPGAGMLARPSLTKMVGATGGPTLQGPVATPTPQGTQPMVVPGPAPAPAPVAPAPSALQAPMGGGQRPGFNLDTFRANHPNSTPIVRAMAGLLAAKNGGGRPNGGGGFLNRMQGLGGFQDQQRLPIQKPMDFGS